jgi:hypothetical protein
MFAGSEQHDFALQVTALLPPRKVRPVPTQHSMP